MEIPLDFSFGLDDSALTQLRGEIDNLPFDRDVAVGFSKDNNIGFVMTKEEKMVNSGTGKLEGIHFAYRLTAQANVNCHFENVQCKIDISKTGGMVKDMDPGESKEGDPVKHTYKDSGELSFTFKTLSLDGKIGGEDTLEANIYTYDVIAFGVDKQFARWEFRKPANHELRLDQTLQILAEMAPTIPDNPNIEITIRFKLRADNLLGVIPFWGRKTIPLNFEQQI